MQQAVCVRRNKTNKNTKSCRTQKHHEIHSSPATVTTSRRRATTHVPRFSPYSPASIDPAFVEIGVVQLSKSVKTTNVTQYTTDKINNVSLYERAPVLRGFFCLVGRKRPRSLRSLGLFSLLTVEVFVFCFV